MTLLILAIVVALVAWALRLMEQAIQGQEFSLMLAGFLVASSAAAMMAVYFLMGHYLVYLDQVSELRQASDLPRYTEAYLMDGSDTSLWEADLRQYN